MGLPILEQLKHKCRGLHMTCNDKQKKMRPRPSHPVMLPHTITERHGGKELWVKAPIIDDVMEKQGFRWRKKWKERRVALHGRELAYYDVSEDEKKISKPRRCVTITAEALLEDLDDVCFSIQPTADEKPWVLRATDAKMKLRWCRALSDCIDIVTWLQHYSMGRVLGVGGNGIVKEVEDKRSKMKFAVKVVDVSKFQNRETVLGEVEILRNITNDIQHPNLVHIHKVYEENEQIFVILDLCPGGELYDSIVHRGFYSEADAAHVMRQLISALKALHDHNILHLDLKPENILMSSKESDAHIVVTDFGLGKMMNAKRNPLEKEKRMSGTVGYIAPEIITSYHYSEAADVFSAGVILYVLLAGYLPFTGDSEVEVLMRTARGNFAFDPKDWGHISAPAKDLVTRMLHVRADERIRVDEILAHPWIQSGGCDTELGATVERMQQFNVDRKTETMGMFVGALMLGFNSDDDNILQDESVVHTMLQRLSSDSRIPVEKAHLIAKAVGLSSYVDEHVFMKFLDRNQDGFIDAKDFCESVVAIRQCDPQYAAIIFDAMLHIRPQVKTQSSAFLVKEHFEVAFELLQCPKDLAKWFFEHLDSMAATSSSSCDTSSDSSPTAASSVSINLAEFTELLTRFHFLGALFIRSANKKLLSFVKHGDPATMAELQRISE